MDRIGITRPLRQELWTWVKKQRQQTCIAQLTHPDWSGKRCHYKLFANGFLEVYSPMSNGQLRLWVAIKIIPRRNGLNYRRGSRGESTIEFKLHVDEVLLKIDSTILQWINDTYAHQIKPLNNFSYPL